MLLVMIDLSGETEHLACRLAEARHVTVEDAIRRALETQAQAAGLAPGPGRTRDSSPDAIAARRAEVACIVREIAALPVLDARDPRDIMDDLNDV